MAATIAVPQKRPGLLPEADAKITVATITGDNSYPAGGYAIAANQVYLGRIDGVFGTSNPQTAGYLPVWDSTNGKLKLYWSTTGAGIALVEVTAATDVSAAVFTLLFIGV